MAEVPWNLVLDDIGRRAETLKRKKTNADLIRAMTDEELAEFFPTTASEFSCPPNSTNESCQNAGGWFNGCPKCWLEWLKQEVTGGEQNQPTP